MIPNNTHNLMTQLTVENKSLWRIQNNYIKDADGNANLVALWQKIAIEKETMIKLIEETLKKII